MLRLPVVAVRKCLGDGGNARSSGGETLRVGKCLKPRENRDFQQHKLR